MRSLLEGLALFFAVLATFLMLAATVWVVVRVARWAWGSP